MRLHRFGLAALVLSVLTQASEAKIVHRWSFATDGKDSVGTAHATLQDGASIVDGKLNLDGQGGYAQLPIGETISKLNSMTIEGWVTWPEYQGAWARIFDIGSNVTSNMFLTPRHGVGVTGSMANAFRFAITIGGSGQEQQINGTEPFPVGAETHFAVTIDAEKGVGKLYLNGKPIATKEQMTVKPSSLGNATANYLGASQYEADPLFRGTIAEFRIYDTALSEAEIADSAKRGPEELNPAAAEAATPAAESKSAAPDAGKSSSELSSSPGGLVHRWSFNGDTNDSVGKANGTLAEGATLADGRLVLNGERAHMALPIGPSIEKMSNVSVETWVKWGERQRPWLRLFDFGARAGKSMYVTPRNGGGRRGGPRNTLRFTITIDGDAGEQQANSADEFPVGAETHVVMSLDAEKDIAKLYVNGKLAATQEGVTLTPSDLGNTANNWIGRSQFPDPFFKGSFDEFRIYSKALSAEEVEASFRAGPDKVPANAMSADQK
jgi:hypothetical protein